MFAAYEQGYLIAMLGAWIALAMLLLLFVVSRVWKKRSPAARWTTRVVLFVWVTAALLTAAETAFALLYDTTDSFNLTKVSQRWYLRHVANNNWGYRDRKPFVASTPPGRRRVAIIGDSFAFGHGIADRADRFGDLLEAKLLDRAPGKWEIYNLATPGNDTGAEVRQLQALDAKGFEVDVVLLAYCLNDLEMLVEQTKHVVGSIILDPPRRWPVRDTYLGNFLYYRYTQFSRPEVRNYFDWLKGAYQGNVWREQQGRLEEIVDWTRDHDAELLVVIFPFFHMLGPDYPFEEAHGALVSFFDRQGIACLDLLPIYRAHADERLTVNPFDAHPNERAHRLAAEAIWTELFPHVLQAAGRAGEPGLGPRAIEPSGDADAPRERQ